MLLRQHPRSQCVCGVVGQYGHYRLSEDGAVVEFGSDAVHGGSGKFAAGFDGALMRVQAREGGQQRGVDVEQSAFVVRHKAWGEAVSYTHLTLPTICSV